MKKDQVHIKADSSARFRSLFDTAPDLVVIMDDRGIVVAANASLQRILGYLPEDIVGTPLSRLMPERYRADHNAGFLRYLSSGQRKLDWTSIRLPGLTIDGDEVPLAISFGEFEEDGRKFFTGILRDVTAEKAAYDDVLRANEMLEAQAAELEQQTDEAQALAEELEAQTAELVQSSDDLRLKSEEAAAANVAKSEFLASMSHELRTPLNAIAGYVELLEMGLRGPITEQQRSDLERIRVSQRHLLSLINDVLNFAKVDAGRIEYDLETVALDAILKTCEAMVLPQIHRKRISYTYEECGEPVYVSADGDKVQQVLINLLSNAIKFTEEGGTLRASCDQTDAVGRVHVTDSGMGIEQGKLEAIFEPFVQIDRSLNQPGQGVGLGLAISRSLARGMGGDIVVESKVGVGSTFTLMLPNAETIK